MGKGRGCTSTVEAHRRAHGTIGETDVMMHPSGDLVVVCNTGFLIDRPRLLCSSSKRVDSRFGGDARIGTFYTSLESSCKTELEMCKRRDRGSDTRNPLISGVPCASFQRTQARMHRANSRCGVCPRTTPCPTRSSPTLGPNLRGKYFDPAFETCISLIQFCKSFPTIYRTSQSEFPHHFSFSCVSRRLGRSIKKPLAKSRPSNVLQ